MCIGIALAWSDLPTELIRAHRLWRRAHRRGRLREVRFHCWDRDPRLPVLRGGQLIVVRWGNRRGHSRVLPRTAWTWTETIRAGGWRGVPAEPVEIPATFALEGRVWYRAGRGIRGLLVPDERGLAVCYMVCEPASHYYQVMTRSGRMPVLIDERI
jgi:hypothetical protein